LSNKNSYIQKLGAALRKLRERGDKETLLAELRRLLFTDKVYFRGSGDQSPAHHLGTDREQMIGRSELDTLLSSFEGPLPENSLWILPVNHLGYIEVWDLEDVSEELRQVVRELVLFAAQVLQETRRDRSLERELQIQRERLEMVLSSIGIGFWYIDLPFAQLNWDHQVRAHFGLPPDTEVTIETFYEHLHPEDRERVAKAIEDAVEQNVSYDIEYRVITGGKIRWIRAIGAAFDGEPRRFDGITLDITHAKRTEEALRSAHQKAVGENQLKSEFLANVSHEIRTPMVGLLGILDFLLKTELDKEQTEYVQTLIDCAESLRRVVDDVLALSRLEAGKLELQPEPCDLPALLRSCRELFMTRSREKNLDLKLDIGPELPTWIEADRARLLQILNNLLSNAVKFTEEGSVILRARVVEDDSLLLEVEDSGMGIPQTSLDKIFDPFVQVDASTSRTYGGTGLGLSIVRRLAHLMEGRVWAESRVGSGSKFSLVLPIRLSEASPDTDRPSVQSKVRGGEILVAEDNPVNGRVISLQLKQLGYKAHCVRDGSEAVKAVRDRDFSLVLMDCQMPGVDGYEATRRIRELGYDRAQLPIIALTAHALEGEREKCLASGMNDYATKPLDVNSLGELVAEWTAGRV